MGIQLIKTDRTYTQSGLMLDCHNSHFNMCRKALHKRWHLGSAGGSHVIQVMA